MNALLQNSLIILVLILYSVVFSVYAPHRRIQKAAWMKTYFAHRGLFTPDQSIPENSLGAIQKAINLGYGSEIDVGLSKDDELFVFHDASLDRMCHQSGLIEETNADELRKLYLANTQERIPSLEDVLNLTKGKVPLMIEIKPTLRRKKTISKVKAALKDYQGNITLVSFDPLIVREIKNQMPEVLRGQLMEKSLHKKQYSILERLILEYALMNGQNRPDYLSHHFQLNNLTLRIHKILGGFSACWPLSSVENEKKCQNRCDCVIFEHYLPKQK